MELIHKMAGYAAAAALTVLLALSCRYDPLDSYSRIPPDRTEEESDDKGGMNGAFESGFGTSDSPYIISTAAHIANISRALTPGEKVYFKLSADIDMKNTVWTPLNSANPFNLFIDFDGDGHIIRNFSCNGQSYSSFFGVLCGECRNVGFVDASVSGSNATGAVSGYLGIASPSGPDFIGAIRNCYVSGSVSGNPAGGLVGKVGKSYSPSDCEIEGCYSSAAVTSTGNCGGIAGEIYTGGVVSGCYATGSVSGGGYAGGVAATLSDGASLRSVVAWNRSISGADGKTGFICGSGTDCEDAYSWLGTVTTLSNTDGKKAEQLREIVAGWGSPWAGNGSEANGYPAPDWLLAREDIADICGQTASDSPELEPEKPDGKIEPEEISEGSGTETDPYLIGTAGQLFSLGSVLKEEETVYVKLTSDIDLKKQNWTPLNNSGAFKKRIDFDGCGHTISNLASKNVRYAGFFGVLYGECRNVKFTDAEIVTDATSSGGVLGGYIGTTGLPGRVSGVEAYGTVTNTAAQNPLGGLAGNAREATIENCTVDVTLTNSVNKATGGIVGYVSGAAEIRSCAFLSSISGCDVTGGIVGCVSVGSGVSVAVEDCLFSGEIEAKQHCGGIAGDIGVGVSVKRCCAAGPVKGWGAVAGIVGRAAGNGWKPADDHGNSIESCIVWIDNITATRADEKGGGSSGAVVGYTGVKNTLKGCIRKPGMTLTANYASELYDQENADSQTPLVIQTPDGYTQIYPYHGKAAAAGTTASDVAKSLNWSEDVWDLSGEVPALKK